MKAFLSLYVLFICFTGTYAQAFELINESTIIEDIGYSQACAWGDYNNDGYLDLYVTNSWINDDNLFYKNNGDGTFTKITEGEIANDGGNSNGCTWGDYNNDGLLDLFIANVNNQNNFFYKNLGNGNFEKITDCIICLEEGWSYSCSWGDYDNDGFLDLYVANYNNQKNFLYHNSQNESFEKIEFGRIVNDTDNSQNCIWSDLNNDGFVDLFVSNIGTNCLYANNQNGTFTKISKGNIVEEISNSYGASIADYNNDGLYDIFITNWRGVNFLYKNVGNFEFERITNGEIVNEISNTEGSSWGDYNNDGYKDLFVTNDGINVLYKNNGDETFSKIDYLNINTDGVNSNGCTLTDYNDDGFLDLFIANGGNQTNLLYYNTKNTNNWFSVKCIGVEHNKSAIGAKVAISSFINNKKIWQFNEINAQSGGGYGSQNGFVSNFGIGNATEIEDLIIIWNNDKINSYKNIPANNTITLIEKDDNLTDQQPQINIFPNPFSELINFEYYIYNNSFVNFKIFNQKGQLIKNCIKNRKHTRGIYLFSIKREEFTAGNGIYYYEFKVDNLKYSGKIIYKKS